MNNHPMNKMRITTTLIVLLFCSTLFAQNALQNDSIQVSIDWSIKENQQHIYANSFQKLSAKHDDFMVNTYWTNKNNEVDQLSKKRNNRKRSWNKTNRPLIYTITRNKKTYRDTVRNSIHFMHDKKSNFRSSISNFSQAIIEGDLPDGVITYREKSGNQIKIGIELPKENMMVKIEILKTDNTLISTLENGKKTKGWHHYSLKTKALDKGTYLLRYHVDGMTRTHQVSLNKEGFNLASIKDFFNRIF